MSLDSSCTSAIHSMTAVKEKGLRNCDSNKDWLKESKCSRWLAAEQDVPAFTELQQKMLETTQKLKLADVQIESLKCSMQHAQLTEKEISNLDPNTKTYESVGRMFLLTKIPEVRSHLQKKSQTCADKIKTLENNKNYLERSLKDSENNLREMVQQRKEMATEAS